MRIWIWTIFCLIMFATIGGFLVWDYFPIPKEVVMPIRNEIEQAIKVKSSDNVIERSKHIGFGGGLGVGVGTAQIVCKSAEQFAGLVSKEERIFTSSKQIEDGKILKKTYLSFLEDRAGVIIYEDEYSYSERGFVYKIKNYDWQKVIFRKQAEDLFAGIIISGVLIFFLWFFVLLFIPWR